MLVNLMPAVVYYRQGVKQIERRGCHTIIDATVPSGTTTYTIKEENMHNLIQWCGSLGLIVSIGVYAADTGPSTKLPEVEYSADRVTVVEDGGRSVQLDTRVNYAPGKERNDMELHGQHMIMILRHDKKLAWILMSDQHKYTETNYAKQAQYCRWPCVNIKEGKGNTLEEGKG